MDMRNKCIILSILISLISGCAAPVLPNTGPSMQQIYRGQTANDMTAVRKKLPAATSVATAPMSQVPQSEQQQLSERFPLLPNPTIDVYIFPHLSGTDNAPVPGYHTAMSLYRENHYALPTEVIRG